MTDSAPVSITVVEPMTQTSIINFEMIPQTVKQNTSVVFRGYLTRTGAIEPRVPSDETGILNGETIELWYLSPWTGLWEGPVAWDTTHDDESAPFPNGNVGWFNAEVFIPDTWLPAGGSYQFRAHYGGNPAKALRGCENDR